VLASHSPEDGGQAQHDVHDSPEAKGNGVDERSVEYVSEQFNANDPAFEAFSDVFARFQLSPDESVVSL
jgi:hypothetical protein